MIRLKNYKLYFGKIKIWNIHIKTKHVPSVIGDSRWPKYHPKNYQVTLTLQTPDVVNFVLVQNACHVTPSSPLSSLRAKGYDTHLYTPLTWLHVMRRHTSSHMKVIFLKFLVIIQVTRENQILYPNNFQMKNRVKTHGILTEITKEFCETHCSVCINIIRDFTWTLWWLMKIK